MQTDGRTYKHNDANRHFSQLSERAYNFSLPKLAIVLYCKPRVAVAGKPFQDPHSFIILSDDRSKASSETIPPHSAI